MRVFVGLLLFFLLLPVSAFAETEGDFWGEWKGHVHSAWESSDYDVFVPVLTWHNRSTYDKDKIKHYNENPWGLGIGRRYYDENRNVHGFMAMAFLDSHDHVEPIAGYYFIKNWYAGCRDEFAFGLGYSMGITARSDYEFIPFPYILPIASLQFQKLSFQVTYVPGTHNNGNVLFGWLKYEL